MTRVTTLVLAKRYSLRHDGIMINYKASDYIIDAIDEFIRDVISELDTDAKFYVLEGLGDVISNQRYELEEKLSEGDKVVMAK